MSNNHPDMYDKVASLAQKYIISKVRECCPCRYDDPQNNMKDQCNKFCGIHCIAIDSSYSYVEKGQSICEIFNVISPRKDQEVTPRSKKRCALCKTKYIPTSNRQKYCTNCRTHMYRKADNARHRKYRSNDNQE